MTKPIGQIILTGDILATRESERASNLRWLSDLLVEPIRAVGLGVSVGLSLDRDALLEAVGQGHERAARHCWIDPERFDEQALAALRAAVPRDALIVGYEMLAGTRAVLSRAGVPWIDLWLHPVRFGDDILMSVDSSEPEIIARLAPFGVDPESLRAQARLLKVQNYRGFNKPAALPEGSLLLVGQTPVDKSILSARGFGALAEFESEIEALMRDHSHSFFAPHPKAKRHEEMIARLLAEGRLTLTTTPSYLLLADPGIAHVAGLSSSLIYEAGFFGKKTTFLMEPPVQWEANATVFQDFVFPHFWAEILTDLADVTPHRRAGFLAPKNKLRDALSFDWGYPAIDRDRFEQIEALEEDVAPGFAERLNGAEVVSFDVFDTLIARSLSDPRDVFLRIGAEQDQPDFWQMRVDAEARARKAANAMGRDDPSLSDIYAHLPLDPAIEIEIELDVVRPRAAGRGLYDQAMAAGKRVVLVSDMYLDQETVTALLNRAGYSNWGALYVSSELGVTKRTGRLWDYVLDQENLRAEDLLHVGDNPVGDGSRAREKGIETEFLPSSKAQFEASGAWAKDAGDRFKKAGLSGSRVQAFLAHDLCDGGVALWDAERFGRAVLGPLLVGFAQYLAWLKPKHLHFLTREGDVMQAVFEALGYEERTSLLYASRALVAPTRITSRDDIETVIARGLGEQSLAAFFERQFGLDPGHLDGSVLDAHGFASPQMMIGPKTDRAALRDVALAHEQAILAACSAMRDRVVAYLEQQGFESGSYLVDIGYNGTVQRAYDRLVSTDLRGAYIGLFETADDLVRVGRASGWLFEHKAKTDHATPLAKHRRIWEALLCAPEGSVIGLDEAGTAQRAPVRDVKRAEFVRAAHKGAVGFAFEWAAEGNKEITPDAGQAMLAAVLDHPTPGLAQLLKDVEFEDAFAHFGQRPLIGTDGASSVWKEGAAALSSDGFAKTASGARRPKWEPWGAYGVLGWRHVLPVFVAPVIGRIGEPHDVDHYREDPIGFFRGLSNARFRKIGKLLYPWDG